MRKGRARSLLGWIFSDRPGSAATRYLVSSTVWFLVATTIGFIGALEMIAPDLLANISWLLFSRLRPMHTNIMLLGWVPAALLGGCLYLVPRVLGTTLWSERLANLTVWIHNGYLVAIVVTLGLGMSQGREYAEAIRPIDIVILGWLALLIVDLLLTIRQRTEKVLYVSVWYATGALLWTFVVYFFGNVVWRADGALRGTSDGLWAWFFGHNVVGLWITPLAIAVAYWVIPRVTGAPIWSHTLSLIGFWTILAIYTHTGAHHLLQAPVPLWIKVLGVVDSIAMLVPVFTFLANIWLPLRARWGRIHADIGGKFVFTGTVYYAIVCVQGPLQSLPSIQRVTHFTQWTVAHAHAAVFGFGGLIAMGAIYYFLPYVSGRKLYSNKLADVQFWIMLVGVTTFFVGLTVAGLVQGHSWREGEQLYRTLPMMIPYMIIRAAAGMAILAGGLIFVWNVAMTLLRGEPAALRDPLEQQLEGGIADVEEPS